MVQTLICSVHALDALLPRFVPRSDLPRRHRSCERGYAAVSKRVMDGAAEVILNQILMFVP
jgi:hypothetical protein